ncbi:class I mannose-6-phosphate isomerase [Elioraea rosea]|uniref:class I mannose-6-phosphate isomerase n=1 Tax=Elioraea rosea TaxID=2492390 RepID=UPI0011869C0F|nr:class I mannose-6-phosphate isomerase [Elioraea rosea]
MTIELADAHAVRKPWGRADVSPWRADTPTGTKVGEIWFERPDPTSPRPALLLKLLFTNEPLSIQVHPNDAVARSMGFEHGKAEAWYIVSAHPHAGVGLGLTRRLGASKLRAAISDRSIAGLVHWKRVRAGDTVYVPGGMIHTIGAGLVLAEIQQRSDTTFRLFDHARDRDLHVENAVAAADTSLRDSTPAAQPLGNGRTVLVATSHFVLERIVIDPDCATVLDAPGETWILVLEGEAELGPVRAARGDAIYVEAERANLAAGNKGLTALIAYGGPEPRPVAWRAASGAAAAPPEHMARVMEAQA